MNTINELDAVALTCDLPAHGLVRGDVGTAVLVHGKGKAFEVEFVGYDGHTVALLTLERAQVRPLQTRDIPTRENWPSREFRAAGTGKSKSVRTPHIPPSAPAALRLLSKASPRSARAPVLPLPSSNSGQG